jgi:GT2 family glycosyltransferase
MKPFIVVATKGRAKETYELLTYLSTQTKPIEKIIVVGSEAKDIADLDTHPAFLSNLAEIHLSSVGSCKQRNRGLDLLKTYVDQVDPSDWFVVFFDDDFRPLNTWIEECEQAFVEDPHLMGLTGRVIADGVHSKGFSEHQVGDFLTGKRAPLENQFSGEDKRALDDLYGCNMAFRGTYAQSERFDENLPMYGWQEDVDYSNRVLAHGTLLFNPKCVGVHMGVSSGRTSGVRFGYSQIANPLYLIGKGTLAREKAFVLMSRNIISNVVRTITFNRKKDYSGRLYGNFLALIDLLTFKCHPTNITKM